MWPSAEGVTLNTNKQYCGAAAGAMSLQSKNQLVVQLELSVEAVACGVCVFDCAWSVVLLIPPAEPGVHGQRLPSEGAEVDYKDMAHHIGGGASWNRRAEVRTGSGRQTLWRMSQALHSFSRFREILAMNLRKKRCRKSAALQIIRRP